MVKWMRFFIGFLICLGLMTACRGAEEAPLDNSAQIHERVLTVDTHVDTPYMLLQEGFDISKVNESGQVDFPRMKSGGLDAVFFAVFLEQGNRTQEDFEASVVNASKRFDLLHQTIETYPELVELALTPEDAYRIEKAEKRAMFLSIENGYSMGIDLSLVKTFYDRGVRLSGLCHGRTNEICDSTTDDPEHGGLSEIGVKVVEEMNRLGITVDVSHISDEAFFDVLEVSQVPVVASHSSARALCDQSRNMTDEMLIALAEKGGVIQLCLLGSFIKEMEQEPARVEALRELGAMYPNRGQSTEEEELYYSELRELDRVHPPNIADVADAVDHIDHIVKLVGIDHVGIGSDFDGGGGLADCKDASELPNVTAELVRRGYSEDAIRKIWGGNFMRVMSRVQDFSDQQ